MAGWRMLGSGESTQNKNDLNKLPELEFGTLSRIRPGEMLKNARMLLIMSGPLLPVADRLRMVAGCIISAYWFVSGRCFNVIAGVDAGESSTSS